MEVSMKSTTMTTDIQVQPMPQGQIKMDILLVTASMQNQNGIRMNDYHRYAKFCRKKINKMRKLYKLTQGKRKFSKIEITPELVAENKILLIAILDAERKWATGMYHKQQLTNIGQDIKQLRYHITRKFKRASRQAKAILEVSKQVCDTQTILEAEAYFSLFEANYLIFKRKFSEALALLKRSSSIYDSISQIKDTIESITYKEKINSIKTSIRLCLYNLSTSKDVIFDEEEFQKSVNVEDIELTEKIEEIKKLSTGNVKEGEQFEIKYHGMNIPIKNDKLKFNFGKISEMSSKIESEPDITKKINMFSDIFNIIDEMVKIVKKEKSEESNQQTENVSKIFTKVLSYLENLRLKKYIEKNIAYIIDASKEFDSLEVITNLYEKDNIKLRIKPQEMIKLYDNLLEYQTQLINLEKENPDQSYLIDLNFRSQVYSVQKIYYAGLFYVLNKKFLDSYTIMHYTLERIKESNEFFELHNLSSVSSLRDLKYEIEHLERLCFFIIETSFVKIAKEKQQNMTSTKMIVDDDKTGVKKEKKIKCNGSMYEEICQEANEGVLSKDNFELFSENLKMTYEEYLESLEKTNYNNYSHIIQLPPNTVLIEPKPIIYDLTFQKFDYPDLQNRTKKEGKGLVGRAFNYFFGKSK